MGKQPYFRVHHVEMSIFCLLLLFFQAKTKQDVAFFKKNENFSVNTTNSDDILPDFKHQWFSHEMAFDTTWIISGQVIHPNQGQEQTCSQEGNSLYTRGK